MKTKIYWRTLNHWLIILAAIIAVPFIVIYMLIFHPRRCMQVWRDSKLEL